MYNTMPEMENALYELFATFKTAVQAAPRHSCSHPSKCLQNHIVTYIFLNSKTSLTMNPFSPKYSSFDPRVFKLQISPLTSYDIYLDRKVSEKKWP
jgi:hypothetical protein